MGWNWGAIEKALGYNLRTWGTSREHDEKMLGTHWDQGRKTKKTPPAPLQKRKNSACWAFPLAAWNFYFQNGLSPFLAWANGRAKISGHNPVLTNSNQNQGG
jgi:hypothetical protein